MRWLKLFSALLAARFHSKLRVTDESSIAFTVWPTDVDVSIMNHAAIMTVQGKEVVEAFELENKLLHERMVQ